MKEPPTPDDLKSHHENQFFFLTFDQYVKVNERKEINNVRDLINLISRCSDLGALQTSLVAKTVVDHQPYSDFLARIATCVSQVEKLRNSVAHNRSHARDTLAHFEEAAERLSQAVRDFFESIKTG
jgi:hypothetical protein